MDPAALSHIVGFVTFDHGPTELPVRRIIYKLASLHPTALCSGKAKLWYPPLPLATVQNDSSAARAF
jgi:hypothetical protein